MSGAAETTRTDGKRDWHAIVFRFAAGITIFVFLAAGGIASILAPWGSPGAPFPGFTPEIHRWHSALLGVSEAILLPGALLGLLRRPREHGLILQFFVLAGIALVLPHVLVRGSTPVTSWFLLLPLLTYPGWAQLARSWNEARPSGALLWLGGGVTLALAPDMWRNLNAQLAHAGGEHARHGHWSTAFALDVTLALAVLAAASRCRGWRALNVTAALALFYLGAAALAIPTHAGSWGVRGGILALIGGGAVLAATWRGSGAK